MRFTVTVVAVARAAPFSVAVTVTVAVTPPSATLAGFTLSTSAVEAGTTACAPTANTPERAYTPFASVLGLVVPASGPWPAAVLLGLPSITQLVPVLPPLPRARLVGGVPVETAAVPSWALPVQSSQLLVRLTAAPDARRPVASSSQSPS